MSLFGAMNTAISGLNAQSAALSNIGDNVANSQTIGFKRIDTRFADYLTTSTAITNQSGAVVARPEYINNVQGTVTQTDNPLSLAITGQGFFAVSKQVGEANGRPVFTQEQQYTRAGDFKLNKDGYVVNGFNQVLNGWPVDGQGQVDRTAMTPIQIGQDMFKPVATREVKLSANLPPNPDPAGTFESQVQVYDARGSAHVIGLNWTPPAAGSGGPWTLTLTAPATTAGGTPTTLGSTTVSFGQTGATAGTISAIGGTEPGTAGQPAAFGFAADFGSGPQNITLDLGTFGGSTGLTNFDQGGKRTYEQRSFSQDGVPPGEFNGLTTRANGDLVAGYTNGQSRVVARVPVVTFPSPNALQRQDGQSFTATREAGQSQAHDAGGSGAGSLVTGSVEGSNVDIGKEFTKLIVAQRAYTANTRLVTTADEMLQQTLDMKR